MKKILCLFLLALLALPLIGCSDTSGKQDAKSSETAVSTAAPAKPNADPANGKPKPTATMEPQLNGSSGPAVGSKAPN